MPPNSRYEFVTLWQIPADIEFVWSRLTNPEAWPTWWRGVQKVALIKPGTDSLGTGAVREYTFRSKLPYRLTFFMRTTRIDPMKSIEGTATGELEGFGKWQLSHENGTTHVRYDWKVVANKWWMRWLAPIARPVFEWNHDLIMEWGQQGLRELARSAHESRR